MGTPEFATASLEALIKAGIQIVAVVTAPDKPAGRGQKLNESAVKKAACAHEIPVLQPEKLKHPDFINELTSYEADLFVIVAFRMLPERVWTIPRLGTINLHASLLPHYRGAAPINHVLINGETVTGVSTFLLQHEIDTGAILFQQEVPLPENITAGELHDTLMDVGAGVLVETVKALQDGKIQPIPQEALYNGMPLRDAPKLSKEDGRIEWENSVIRIHNRIRGLSPYPGAFTTFEGKTLKLYKTSKQLMSHGLTPGSLSTDGKTYLKIAGTDGWIDLLEIQLEGKKRLSIVEFLRGYKFSTKL